jgi:hypothetical protein
LRRFGKHARHVRHPRWLAAGAVSACLLGLSTVALTSASAGTTPPVSTPAAAAPDSLATDALSPATARALSVPAGTEACPEPTSLLQMQCQVLIDHKRPAGDTTLLRPGTSAVKAQAITTALGPTDLQDAYGLEGSTGPSATDGKGETVAIVDAFGDSHIGSDLATYRANWGLPACDTTTLAGCLSVFNEEGQTSPLPANPPTTSINLSWEDETALDVEMVSAICPNCHIDLFQASSDNISDLGLADDSAAKVSKFVSNSWSGGDFPGENAYDNEYFNHPGVAMVFASGDYGFGATWPSSDGLVTSVGGTYLQNASDGTDYTESVWNQQDSPYGTAAGCSSGEGKPSWQTDSGCANRTQNDVSAVADAPAGIDEYSSSTDCNYTGAFGPPGEGEENDCATEGTSVATPIITALYALANPSGPATGTYPVSYLYQSGHTADLNQIGNNLVGNDLTGTDGTCESSRAYLCNARASLANGYNGPTGLGSPKGIGAFADSATTDIVSIDNPGNYDLTAGTRVTLPAIGVSDSESSTLTYSAAGLPSTMSINSATGVISGTMPSGTVNDTVTVTVKDATGASASVHFGFAGVKMNGSYHAGTGEVDLVHVKNTCMNDPHNATNVDAAVATYPCAASSSQDWSYSMPAGPGQAGQISIHGKCASILGGKNKSGSNLVGLVNCSSTSGLQQWELTGYDGEIVNLEKGWCLTDPNSSTAANTQFTAQSCTGIGGQTLVVPASPVTSGIAGKCLADSSGTAVSTACTGSSSQKVTLGLDGSLQFSGYCIYNAASSPNDGTAIKLLKCSNTNYSEEWGISAYGQIENLTTEKCLAIPGNSTANGAKLALEDCYGQPGEVWSVS